MRKIILSLMFVLGLMLNPDLKKTEEEVLYLAPASDVTSLKTISTLETNNTLQLKTLNTGDCLDYYQGDGVKIAIIDSGINVEHEEFFDSTGNSIISSKSASFTNSNYFSSGRYTFAGRVETDGLSVLDDENGHGTNVAGIIAAQLNDKGIAGLAPNAELIILKTDYSFNAINAAIRYAADLGVDVINMSIQSYLTNVSYGNSSLSAIPNCDKLLKESINYAYEKDCLIVAAAGNYNTSEKSYPAANDHVLGVGSLAENSYDTKAGFSNYGDYVDLVAPGYVYTTAIGGSNKYVKTYGTSFSCPIVSALAAIYKNRDPNATCDDIAEALKASCESVTSIGLGKGRVDVTNLLAGQLVESLDLSFSESAIYIGDICEINSIVLPENAMNKSLKWTSSNSDVIDVDETGCIMAYDYGEVTITATTRDGSNISKSITLKAIPRESDYLTISNNRLEFKVGETFTPDLSETEKAVVYLHYSATDYTDVSDLVEYSTPDMSKVGKVTVTVSYKNALSLTYEINIVPDEKVDAVKEMITQLPNIDDLTISDEESVLQVLEAYEGLSDSQQAQVDITKVQALKTRVGNLKYANQATENITLSIEEFQKVRTNISDLSAINEKINKAQETYDLISEESVAQSVTNKEYLASFIKAYDFISSWYQNVRVAKTSRARAVTYSICESLTNEKMKEAIQTYDSYDALTQEVIASSFDVLSDGGEVITIGESLDYGRQVLEKNTEINVNQKISGLLFNGQNGLIAVVLVTFIVMIALNVIILKRKYQK